MSFCWTHVRSMYELSTDDTISFLEHRLVETASPHLRADHKAFTFSGRRIGARRAIVVKIVVLTWNSRNIQDWTDNGIFGSTLISTLWSNFQSFFWFFDMWRSMIASNLANSKMSTCSNNAFWNLYLQKQPWSYTTRGAPKTEQDVHPADV